MRYIDALVPTVLKASMSIALLKDNAVGNYSVTFNNYRKQSCQFFILRELKVKSLMHGWTFTVLIYFWRYMIRMVVTTSAFNA